MNESSSSRASQPAEHSPRGITFTELAQQLIAPHLNAGDIAIDATAGNGHDTLFLCEQVGPTGRVIACDLQPPAIAATQKRCQHHPQLELVQQDHSQLLRELQATLTGRVAAILFNLGYLPGTDKAVITRTETTIPALEAAIPLLQPGGILSILAYPGHPGGAAETTAVEATLHALRESPLKPQTLYWPRSFSSNEATLASPPRLYVLQTSTEDFSVGSALM